MRPYWALCAPWDPVECHHAGVPENSGLGAYIMEADIMNPILGPDGGPKCGTPFGPCMFRKGPCMFSSGPCMLSKGPHMFSAWGVPGESLGDP